MTSESPAAAHPYRVLAPAAIDDLEQRYSQHSTLFGIAALDHAVGVVVPGQSLAITASHPADATTVLYQTVLSVLNSGRSAVLLVSRRPLHRVVQRLLALAGMIDVRSMLTAALVEQDWQSIDIASQRLAASGLALLDSSGNPDDVEVAIRSWVAAEADGRRYLFIETDREVPADDSMLSTTSAHFGSVVRITTGSDVYGVATRIDLERRDALRLRASVSDDLGWETTLELVRSPGGRIASRAEQSE